MVKRIKGVFPALDAPVTELCRAKGEEMKSRPVEITVEIEGVLFAFMDFPFK